MEENVPRRREVLLILTLFQQIFSSSKTDAKDLYLDPSLKTWTEASNDCLLVTSNNTLSLGVPVTDIPVLQHPTCKPTTERSHQRDFLWIGAKATFTPWFELLGCYMYHKFENNPNTVDFGSSLGPITKCYQICRNYTTFGINRDTCICAHNVTYGRKFSSCCKFNTSVYFKNDIIGTNKMIKKYLYQGFAMYRKKVITKIDDTLGECLMKTKKGKKTLPCDSADILNRTWPGSFIKEANLNEDTHESLPHWLPYVRRLIISLNNGTKKKASTVADAQQDGTVCISVKDQDGLYEVVPMRCNETYSSICQTQTAKMLSDCSSQQTMISVQPLDHSPATDQRNNEGTKSASQQTSLRTPESGVSTGQISSTTQTPISTQSKQQIHMSDSVIFGCVLGIISIVIIVAVIVVIIVKKRSQSKTNESSSAPTESDVTGEKGKRLMLKNDSSPTINNTCYETISIINEMNTSKESEEYGKLLCSGKADVYNHTWDKPITEQLTDHVYSTTRSGNDANVYDHTVTNKSN